jgi:TonB family protein
MSGFEGLLTGRVLADRYLVEELIGRGGMGAVYQALDQRLGRPVAVKVIMVPGADAVTHARLRQRFLREAQLAAGLRHPNVVTVHDFGTDDTLGLDYLVMALLEGEDLASLTAGGRRLPAAAALTVVAQAARGLTAGHRRGLVHRDVKPGNLFLETDEHGEAHVRILDFGIAQVAFDEPALTMAGRDPLSPTYAAPEQLRGGERLTAAADVFSLAAVALYLLTGQRPFTGDAATQAAEAEAALARLAAAPEATPALHDVLRRALEIDPGRRWPDAETFRQALERAHGPGLETLPAAVVAGAAGPARGADDDVTLFADDRTLHADAGAPLSAAAARGAVAPAARPPAPVPATAAPRRAGGVAPAERRSRAPMIAVGALALAGALAYAQPWKSDEPQAPVAVAAPDSAALDSLARAAEADSLARIRREQALIGAALDSARRVDSIARENERQAMAAAVDTTFDAPAPGPGPAPDAVLGMSDVERLPQPRNMNDVTRYLQRNYPPLLRDSGVEGAVELSLIVDREGRPERGSMQVLSSTDPLFNDPAMRAVERLRFRPAQLGGQDVRVRVSLPIRFNLNR